MYLNLQRVQNDEDFFTALCYETGLQEDLRGYRLGRELEKQAAGQTFVVGLDEIECLSAEQFTRGSRDTLRGLADSADSPLTLLIASRAPLDTLFPDSTTGSSPLAGICQVTTLPPFTFEETVRFLEGRAGRGFFTTAEMEAIWRESGGNPRRIQELAEKAYRRKC